ncbi:apolipoprotein D-like [Rhincodon typus]|uniref:apolipoprotein D-like n=1 Tax=Rhincodon typus TaxID=259920 RepID=UPI002030E1FB|nr:apolipoprotein D-like [Rhincodon typus]
MRGLLLSLMITSICLTKRVQAIKWGRCEHVELQKNFSLNQYMGTWYEIERLYNVTGERRCISETISKAFNGFRETYELLTWMIKDNDAVVVLSAELIPPPKANKDQAKLTYRLDQQMGHEPLDDSVIFHYWVVDTDYTSYSLVFSCVSFLGIAHTPYAWILSRERQLSANTTKYLHDILDKYNINIEDLVKINQEGCI